MGNDLDSYKEFNKECHILTPEVLQFFIDSFVVDKSQILSPQLSPLMNSDADFKHQPRTFVLAAELDPFSSENKLYHEKLVSNGVNSTHILVRGVPHGFLYPLIMKESCAETVKHLNEFFSTL